MKKLAIVTAVVALVTGFAATDAAANHRENHNKGDGSDSFQVVLQAPFIDVTTAPGKADSCKDSQPSGGNGVCDGSEGRIASNGAISVTIQGVAGEPGGYDLCLDVNGDGDISDIGGTCVEATICTVGKIDESCVSNTDCDLVEFVANASPDGATLVLEGNLIADGIINPGSLLDAPFFEVYSGGAGACPGVTLEFRSGIVIN